jgi:hypothetical protein
VILYGWVEFADFSWQRKHLLRRHIRKSSGWQVERQGSCLEHVFICCITIWVSKNPSLVLPHHIPRHLRIKHPTLLTRPRRRSTLIILKHPRGHLTIFIITARVTRTTSSKLRRRRSTPPNMSVSVSHPRSTFYTCSSVPDGFFSGFIAESEEVVMGAVECDYFVLAGFVSVNC